LLQVLQEGQFLEQAAVVVHSLQLALWAATAAEVMVVEFLAELQLSLDQKTQAAVVVVEDLQEQQADLE
jgi:hypothetical protein